MPPRGRASSTVVPSVVGPEAVRLVAAKAGPLTALALGRMEEDLEWYPRLSAEDRSWIGLVAQAGVGAFVRWLRRDADTAGPTDRYGRPRNPITVDVFGTAPRELTWSISLGQALDLVRLVVDVVEEGVLDLAPPADREAMREAVLRYSREVAFAAAQVYAEAAEARGAWDARLEALVVDAVVRGEADDSMQSRATALGWGSVSRVTVVAGSTPPGSSAAAVDTIHRAAAEADAQALAAVQRRRFVVVLGGTRDALATVTALSAHFGPGPIVVGPTVPHLFAAGRSARAALSGLAASPAWPQAPRPVAAAELLPERALAGDAVAKRALVDRIYRPLLDNESLLSTASTFVEVGGSLEAAARALFVHPNTVRYRLGRIAEVTGYDLTHPREAHTAALALALGRLADPPPVEWRAGAPVRGSTSRSATT